MVTPWVIPPLISKAMKENWKRCKKEGSKWPNAAVSVWGIRMSYRIPIPNWSSTGKGCANTNVHLGPLTDLHPSGRGSIQMKIRTNSFANSYLRISCSSESVTLSTEFLDYAHFCSCKTSIVDGNFCTSSMVKFVAVLFLPGEQNPNRF